LAWRAVLSAAAMAWDFGWPEAIISPMLELIVFCEEPLASGMAYPGE